MEETKKRKMIEDSSDYESDGESQEEMLEPSDNEDTNNNTDQGEQDEPSKNLKPNVKQEKSDDMEEDVEPRSTDSNQNGYTELGLCNIPTEQLPLILQQICDGELASHSFSLKELRSLQDSVEDGLLGVRNRVALLRNELKKLEDIYKENEYEEESSPKRPKLMEPKAKHYAAHGTRSKIYQKTSIYSDSEDQNNVPELHSKYRLTTTVRDKNDYLCAKCELGGELLCCDGPCLRSFHLPCAGLTSFPTTDQWFCPDCHNKRHQCFQCKAFGQDELEVKRCSVGSCGKFYHPECISKLELAKVEGDRFFCPLHRCAKCGGSGKDTETLHCVRCPVSYHKKCVPSRPKLPRLGYKRILCPNHVETTSMKVSILLVAAAAVERQNLDASTKEQQPQSSSDLNPISTPTPTPISTPTHTVLSHPHPPSHANIVHEPRSITSHPYASTDSITEPTATTHHHQYSEQIRPYLPPPTPHHEHFLHTDKRSL